MDFPGGGQVGIDVQVFLGLFYRDLLNFNTGQQYNYYYCRLV